MKRIHALALATLITTGLQGVATAADLYLGASIGRADYRIDTTGAIDADTKDTAGKVFVGKALTPHIGVEASLFSLGKASGSVGVPGVGTVRASAQARGIGVSGVFSAPLGPVSAFAKLGIAHVRTRAEASVATGLPGSENTWQPTAGLGVSVPIASQFVLRGEWERLRARFPGGEKDNVDLLSVGLAYRF